MTTDILFGPFGAALLVVIGVLAFSWHDGDFISPKAARLRSLLLGVTAVAALGVAARAAMPQTPIATGDLTPGAPGMEIPATDTPLALLVQGKLPSEFDGSVHGTYSLSVLDEQSVAAQFKGDIEEHHAKRRVGRGGSIQTVVMHLEDRFILPDTVRGRALTVRADTEDATLEGPLELSVVPAPPGGLPIVLGGVILILCGARIDLSTIHRGHLALTLGYLTFFLLLLARGVTPHGSASRVLEAAIGGFVLGVPAGMLLRAILRLVRSRSAPRAA